MAKQHRFLKAETIQYLKSKGALNESEAAEVFADLEAYQKKAVSLQENLEAKVTLINNGWEEERFALQTENERMRKLLAEDEESFPLFKMDHEGNLTRIKDGHS